MNTIEIKARQLVSRYGADMAQNQANFFARRASGAMADWWRAVQACIRGLPAHAAGV